MRLTSDHWEILSRRADGATYATIALERDLSIEQVLKMLDEVRHVIILQINSQVGGGVDGPVQ